METVNQIYKGGDAAALRQDPGFLKRHQQMSHCDQNTSECPQIIQPEFPWFHTEDTSSMLADTILVYK
jgi:hypothetical protein